MTIGNLNERLMASIPPSAETEENNEYITNIEDINNPDQTDACTDANLLNSVTKIVDEKMLNWERILIGSLQVYQKILIKIAQVMLRPLKQNYRYQQMKSL